MFTFAIDKVRLLDHFRKDPVLFGYHIGDLDDFFFPHCQFPSIYSATARIEDTVLIYAGGTAPTVLAFGLTDRFEGLLREVSDFFPAKFFCHYLRPYRSNLEERFREKQLGTHHKMKLEGLRSDAKASGEIVRLSHENSSGLIDFYREAYPSNYFTPRMLETGKYFGIRDGKKLAAVAGVHVYSKEYKIAVLGNIATLPEYRGKGLASAVTGHLCAELVSEGLMVCLNVKGDNSAAIRCYEKLGFVKVCEYEEGWFEGK